MRNQIVSTSALHAARLKFAGPTVVQLVDGSLHSVATATRGGHQLLRDLETSKTLLIADEIFVRCLADNTITVPPSLIH